MSTTLLIDILFGSLGLYLFKSLLYPRKARGPLPPGPTPKPFIGNLTDLPPTGEQEWVHWGKHKDLYGTLYFFFSDYLLCTRSLNIGFRPS